MPPPPRARTALQAMKTLGFAAKESVPVLKKLLEVYDDNWEYIEENNYQVLIDSILEAQGAKAEDHEKQDIVADDHPENKKKRLRKLSEVPSPSMIDSDEPGDTLLKKPKEETDVSPEVILKDRRADPIELQMDNRGRTEIVSPHGESRGREEPVSSRVDNRSVMTKAVLPQPSTAERADHLSPIKNKETRSSDLIHSREKVPSGERPSNSIYLKVPKIEPDTELQNNFMSTSPPRSKDKVAGNDLPEFEAPTDTILPSHLTPAEDEGVASLCQQSRGDSSLRNLSSLQRNAPQPLAAKDADKGKQKISDNTLENEKPSEFIAPQDLSSSTIDIASSNTGAVKLLLSFDSDHHDPHISSPEALFKMVEERYLESYKTLPSEFSLQKVMNEICQLASELTAEPMDEGQEEDNDGTPASSVNGSLTHRSARRKVCGHKQ